MGLRNGMISLAASFIAVLFALSGLSGFAAAAEVAGVKVPEIITLEPGGVKLVLNGAGIRKKFVIKVYVGALYLTKYVSTVDEVLSMSGPKRIEMTFLYKKVAPGKLQDTWTGGFRKNLRHDEYGELKDSLKEFNALFDEEVRKGDVITLDYVPGTGTTVIIKGKKKGTVEGAGFNRALLLVWLGKKPADKGLKAAMLGR